MIIVAAVGLSYWYLNRAQPENFALVHREAISITAATSVGVTYLNFRDAVTRLTTEINVVKSKARTNAEKAIVADLEEGSGIYKDSLDLWAMKIELRDSLLSGEIQTVANLAEKYDATPDERGRYNADALLQVAWARGKAKLSDAQAKIEALSR